MITSLGARETPALTGKAEERPPSLLLSLQVTEKMVLQKNPDVVVVIAIKIQVRKVAVSNGKARCLSEWAELEDRDLETKGGTDHLTLK